MNARDYYLSLQNAIHAAPHVLRSDVRFEEIDINPTVSTFPDHRHDDHDGVHPAPPMNVPDVLDAVLQFV